MTEPIDVVERLAAVRAQVDAAAQEAGRDPASVRMLIATKTQPPAAILAVLRAGSRLIGENRVQEVTGKAEELAGEPHETHFIGHLQSNKINALLPHISCLQTLDSVDLAQHLQRRLSATEATLSVMLQVNVSGESTKSGVTPAELPLLARQVAGCDRLAVTGLMTIGRNSPDVTAVRSGYRTLARLAAELGVAELSMGMSGDFAAAVAEGATIVRLGSAVFGPR